MLLLLSSVDQCTTWMSLRSLVGFVLLTSCTALAAMATSCLVMPAAFMAAAVEDDMVKLCTPTRQTKLYLAHRPCYKHN